MKLSEPTRAQVEAALSVTFIALYKGDGHRCGVVTRAADLIDTLAHSDRGPRQLCSEIETVRKGLFAIIELAGQRVYIEGPHKAEVICALHALAAALELLTPSGLWLRHTNVARYAQRALNLRRKRLTGLC
jgi:hypothetical protein